MLFNSVGRVLPISGSNRSIESATTYRQHASRFRKTIGAPPSSLWLSSIVAIVPLPPPSSSNVDGDVAVEVTISISSQRFDMDVGSKMARPLSDAPHKLQIPMTTTTLVCIHQISLLEFLTRCHVLGEHATIAHTHEEDQVCTV